MMERAGYNYDSGPRFRQMSILWTLQKLMKNDLDIKEPFLHQRGKYLIFNSLTGDVEIDKDAYKEHFMKKAAKIRATYNKNSSTELIYAMQLLRVGYKIEFGEDMPEL
jgi:hypothetical protein